MQPSPYTAAAAAAQVSRLVKPPHFILGSKSGSRRAILSAAGASFDVVVADIDERAIGDRTSDAPAALVQQIAVAKSDALLAQLRSHKADGQAGSMPPGWPESLKSGTVLLTSDQVVTYGGKIREKPDDLAQARSFVDSYSVGPCGTCGGYCLHDLDSGLRIVGGDSTSIHFKPLPAVSASFSETDYNFKLEERPCMSVMHACLCPCRAWSMP
eukprot:SAG31_NODE_53_length_30139_cov_31.002197_24_plen_213_part_00